MFLIFRISNCEIFISLKFWVTNSKSILKFLHIELLTRKIKENKILELVNRFVAHNEELSFVTRFCNSGIIDAYQHILMIRLKFNGKLMVTPQLWNSLRTRRTWFKDSTANHDQNGNKLVLWSLLRCLENSV